jgi:hypothetical protein
MILIDNTFNISFNKGHMESFQINSTLNGEPVVLTIEYIGDHKRSKQLFNVKKDSVSLATIQVDGRCIVTPQSRNLFNESDIQRLCRQVYKYKGTHN